jgi:predicted transcriptional regulator
MPVSGSVHPTWVPVLTDPVRLTILGALSQSPLLTSSELSRRVHVGDRAVRRHLEVMSSLGLVHEHRGERDGLTPGRPASRYALDPSVEGTLQALFGLLTDPLPAAAR